MRADAMCTCGHLHDIHEGDGECLAEENDETQCPCIHFEAADNDSPSQEDA